MARHGITYKAVSECAEQLLEAGTQPTVLEIRARLNGNKNTIARHLKRWEQLSAQVNSESTQSEVEEKQVKALNAVADELPDTLLEMVKNFWQKYHLEQQQNEHNRATPNHSSDENSTFGQLREHIELIQHYVGDLERELAESTSEHHRLLSRLAAFEGINFSEPASDDQSETQESTACLSLIEALESVHHTLDNLQSPNIKEQSQTPDLTDGSSHQAENWLAASPQLDETNFLKACDYLKASLERETRLKQNNLYLIDQVNQIQKASEQTETETEEVLAEAQ